MKALKMENELGMASGWLASARVTGIEDGVDAATIARIEEIEDTLRDLIQSL